MKKLFLIPVILLVLTFSFSCSGNSTKSGKSSVDSSLYFNVLLSGKTFSNKIN